VKFLSSADIGVLAFRNEPVHKTGSPLRSYPVLQTEAVPYFKASRSAEVSATEVIDRNLELVEAASAFHKAARGRISEEALRQFSDQNRAIVRDGISLGADLTEQEHLQNQRNIAAGYLAFEATTWLIPAGRIGAAIGGKAGAAATRAAGGQSVSAISALKTFWQSGKALRSMSTGEKLRRMRLLSSAGFYSGAVLGGAYSVAEKVIDSVGREQDFLCELAKRYERDGNSARAALVGGLIGAGGGGLASIAPRIGLLLGAGATTMGGAETAWTLEQAQALYEAGDSAGAVRELSRAGLTGAVTLSGVRSGLQSLRASAVGAGAATPPTAAKREPPAQGWPYSRLELDPKSPSLARRIHTPPSPARQGVLHREWTAIDGVVQARPGLAGRALADPKIRFLRGNSSNTLRQRANARTDWEKTDESIQRWARGGEPITVDKIIALNRMVRSQPGASVDDPGIRHKWLFDGVQTMQAVRNRPTGMKPTTYSFLPNAGPGRKLVERTYIEGRDVPKHLNDFDAWLRKSETGIAEGRLHPIDVAAEAYQRLVSIHPFHDGNGRTTRLVMDWILLKHGYPPPVLVRTRKNVAIFEDEFSRDRNLSPGAAQVKITQGIRETIRLLNE